MTSQKSLKNNVNFNDFKRALCSNLIFAVAAFVVTFFMSTMGLLQLQNNIKNGTIIQIGVLQMFFQNPYANSVDILFIVMVFCGMLMALKSYHFLISKKETNVYLSMGITRTTLFVNRTLSAIILLFTSVFVPLFISYLVNLSLYGNSTLLHTTFLYLVGGLFVSGFAGYAIVLFAMTISGGLIDTGLVTIFIFATPYLIVTSYENLNNNWLKGLDFSSWYHIDIDEEFLTPLTFVTRFSRSTKYYSKQEFFGEVSKSETCELYQDGIKAIPFDYVLPVLLWFAIAVVLCVLALVLLKARKAEHAHSVGNFALSRGITCAFVFLLITLPIIYLFAPGNVVSDKFEKFQTLPMVALIIALLTLVAHFIIQFVMTRKIKTSLKSLTVWAGLAAVMVFAFAFVGTEHFGNYNKLPAKEDVKSVSIDYNEYGPYIRNDVHADGVHMESSNPEDIEMVLELFEKAKNNTGDRVFTSIAFSIIDKDGNEMIRRFRISSREIYNEYIETVTNSNFFDALLEQRLLGFNDKGISANGQYYVYSSKVDEEDITVAVPDFISKLTYPLYSYVDNQGVVNNVKIYDESDVGLIDLENNRELATALYNDLSKLTYKEIFKNPEKPVGVFAYVERITACKTDQIIKMQDDYFLEDMTYEYGGVQYANTEFCIYKNMTETLKYLDDNNITFEGVYEGEVKEILYTDSPLYLDSAIALCLRDKDDYYTSFIYDDYINEGVEFGEFATLSVGTFENIQYKIDKDTTCYDILKLAYSDIDHTLLTAKAEKFDSILANTVTYFNTYGDNGRFVYIIYEDGTMVCQYLPEANVGVLN